MSTSSSSRSGWTTLIWLVVALLAALWSGGAWLLGSLLSWVVDTAGATPAATDWVAVFKTWEPPPWLMQMSAWLGWGDVAQWQGLAQAVMEGLATSWPWLAEALSWLQPVLVVIWVVGLLALLVLGGLVHAWVRWMVRQNQPRPANSQVAA